MKEKIGKEEKNIHAKHRQRLKQKFLEYGSEVLSEHEFLELLLFFSVPYKNTNELAHQLLEEFGSFSQILEAKYDVLRDCGIKDMKDNSACLFKVILSCISRYIGQKNDITKAQITPQNIGTFAQNLFFGHSDELSYAVLLDKDCYVKKVKMISEGTMNATPMYPREVVKFALSQEEPYVIVMHNHPNGTARPSDNDIAVTKTLINALNYVDVRLVDHIIVAGSQIVSLARDYNIFDL